jgi:hypothetical protein
MSLVEYGEEIVKCFVKEKDSSSVINILSSILETVNIESGSDSLQSVTERTIDKYIEELTGLMKPIFGEETYEVLRGVHLMNYIVDSNKIRDIGVWMEEWMISYIEQQLNINIYILSNRTRQMHSSINGMKRKGKINVVLINNDNIHFEVIAKKKNKNDDIYEMIKTKQLVINTLYSENEIRSLI